MKTQGHVLRGSGEKHMSSIFSIFFKNKFCNMETARGLWQTSAEWLIRWRWGKMSVCVKATEGGFPMAGRQLSFRNPRVSIGPCDHQVTSSSGRRRGLYAGYTSAPGNNVTVTWSEIFLAEAGGKRPPHHWIHWSMSWSSLPTMVGSLVGQSARELAGHHHVFCCHVTMIILRGGSRRVCVCMCLQP